jgi:hypothetical protein
LDESELAILRAAVLAADAVDELGEIVKRDGLLDPEDGRPHAALIELRAQSALLAKLVTSLRVPIPEERRRVNRPPRRGARGSYGVRGLVG